MKLDSRDFKKYKACLQIEEYLYRIFSEMLNIHPSVSNLFSQPWVFYIGLDIDNSITFRIIYQDISKKKIKKREIKKEIKSKFTIIESYFRDFCKDNFKFKKKLFYEDVSISHTSTEMLFMGVLSEETFRVLLMLSKIK